MWGSIPSRVTRWPPASAYALGEAATSEELDWAYEISHRTSDARCGARYYRLYRSAGARHAPAQAGSVIVRVHTALTDGTDLKAFRRGDPKMPMPTLFGHEFSGDIVALGEGVTAFAQGDAVEHRALSALPARASGADAHKKSCANV